MKTVKQQAAASSATGDPAEAPAEAIACQECYGMGYPDATPKQPCPACRGTGHYTGIPDAYGQPGVTAISVANDSKDTSAEPRQLVRLETFACEIPLTLDGAEHLASRLYDAVYEVRHSERERAHTDALASGERPLASAREALGTRAYFCLARAGVLTVEQAAGMTDAELLCIVNLGIGTLQRIRAVVGRSSGTGQAER